ncbi:CBM_collapsed_G0035300.mRNA.1.CDS.1 [Saccharomyces cerevisiae]|nr:CBM_collapsed_G0035300.mRNA.1.CDS.1 [Saccharomyces cerevisiae]
MLVYFLHPLKRRAGQSQTDNGPNEADSAVHVNRDVHSMFNNDSIDDFHTANITSTGQILKLPDSSDEDTGSEAVPSREQTDLTGEGHGGADDEQDESTIQRQSRKRKISLLLQQQYGSSSSMVPSPIVPNKMRKQLAHEEHINNDGDNDDENSNNIESSPLKQGHHHPKGQADDNNEGPDEEESTKEVPKPGTIIHFSTNR